MKTSDAFKKTIREYLEQRAKEDELFAVSYAKENKSVDECCNFILQQVQKSGCNGFNDDEIFGMAVHYYDEDSIKDVKPINCNVVVNHSIELTEEEKKAAREAAIKKLQDEQYSSLKKKPAKKKEDNSVQQTSLF
ncbi:PcfK-like family protein [Bacteroides ihuae]|uniref:PcfK-like family protein n=1 Tax=Bacteroides ihuae TaxID=1852362 RepID=UPI0008D9AAF2|nr:PcfK-like family protein [Bacteroides ihuae]